MNIIVLITAIMLIPLVMNTYNMKRAGEFTWKEFFATLGLTLVFMYALYRLMMYIDTVPN